MATTFAFAQTTINANPANIVIVHGSWSSAADWEAVSAKLRADGNQVTVVNLPGHGTDQTSITSISLQGYVDAVKKAINGSKEIVLVGHSFGGIVVSAVAEQIPLQIKKLVYVAAYIPQNGESLLTIANTDAASQVGKYLQIDEKAGIAGIAKEGIASTFVADAPKGVQDYVTTHFRAEPLVPLASPVMLSAANFGRVAKIYIHTYNDQVNSLALQQKMVKATDITRFYGLPSSHTPFVSMPLTLAAIIAGEAK
ncbi:alpha/beta fold hydrolase [Pedobacter sp. ISL-64]|uniref:alpha/beta fold hydrolase n=1 Tax=Pedobacter sp. ISL-64 TaxID=2819164 RepID=UPI002035FE29|nr:alpha/beta fold hydrolase [Pedobacter sp. ISL-64]